MAFAGTAPYPASCPALKTFFMTGVLPDMFNCTRATLLPAANSSRVPTTADTATRLAPDVTWNEVVREFAHGAMGRRIDPS